MNLDQLLTEARNPASEHLDELSTLDMLTVMNDEDRKVAEAVRAELPRIAAAVDAITARLREGGRVFYLGAGTSGRLGVLDASECPPTFSVPADLVQGLIAGGDRALRLSSEHTEDSHEEGVRDLEVAGFSGRDCLVGIAASGRTPYVIGGLVHARALGAFTVALTCVADSEMGRVAEINIAPVTGPEVVTGSTRMKAGTATKLVLNMLSTGVMVRMGAVYGNLMVNVRPSNTKLVARAQRIVASACGCDLATAGELLSASGGSVKTAIVMQLKQLDRASAEELLIDEKGVLRQALA